jgi:hypothetical protein
MNKHAIILPMILTSAVSLHVLSFYLEEPEEIVDNPTPISSPVDPTQSASVTEPSEVQVAANPSTNQEPNVNVSPNATINNKNNNKNTTVNPDSKNVKVVTSTSAPVVTNNTVTTTTTTVDDIQPSPVPDNKIQVAAALIPTKSYDEMVKEAKQIGGRVDPFLSMKPPEAEPLPELPVIEKTFVAQNNKPGSGIIIKKPGFQHRGEIPSPPAFIPENTNTKIASNNQSTKNNKIYIPLPKGISATKSNTRVTTKSNTNGSNTDIIRDGETIVITPEIRIDEGLELTGIITGNKKLALIKVDDENKVFGVGDIIRRSSGIKIVSINYENDTITISDSKNRRTRLDIK